MGTTAAEAIELVYAEISERLGRLPVTAPVAQPITTSI